MFCSPSPSPSPSLPVSHGQSSCSSESVELATLIESHFTSGQDQMASPPVGLEQDPWLSLTKCQKPQPAPTGGDQECLQRLPNTPGGKGEKQNDPWLIHLCSRGGSSVHVPCRGASRNIPLSSSRRLNKPVQLGIPSSSKVKGTKTGILI